MTSQASPVPDRPQLERTVDLREEEDTPAELIRASVDRMMVEQVLEGAIEEALADFPKRNQQPAARAFPEEAVVAIFGDLFDEVRRNGQHRRRMDMKLAGKARLSLVLTWLLVVMVLVSALVLALRGSDVVAGAFLAGGFGSMVVALLRGGGGWEGRSPPA